MNENIKNIAKIINSKCRFQNCNDCIKSEDTCWEFETATALVKAGYRKRSETVKEFAEKVKDILDRKIRDHGATDINMLRTQSERFRIAYMCIHDLAEQFGKE